MKKMQEGPSSELNIYHVVAEASSCHTPVASQLHRPAVAVGMQYSQPDVADSLPGIRFARNIGYVKVMVLAEVSKSNPKELKSQEMEGPIVCKGIWPDPEGCSYLQGGR